jgi:hypothetical protein
MSPRLLWLLVLVPGTVAAEPFVKGPYLQRATQTGVTVMWQSDTATTARIVVSGAGEPERVVAAPAETMHEVRVDGLTPGRRYRYVVEQEGRTAGGELMTAAQPHEPFSFIVFGDTRSNVASHRQVVERIRREVPDFILLTGDMVDDGAKEVDWQSFFDVERDLLRENVFYPAVGNHDRHGRNRGADAYRRYFSLPADTPDPERYYAITYGNSRFFILDSNEHSFALTDQTAWLDRELRRAAAEPGIQHRFVVMHHPPFSSSLHGGQPELREMWTPLFERFGVEAVFSGHDHTYEHAEKNGVRYLVSGGGGAPLYPRDPRASAEDKAASRYFERTLHYIRVHVTGGFVEIAAIRADGSLIETLSWGSLPRDLVATAAPTPPAPSREPTVTVAGAVPATETGGCNVGGGSASAWLALAALAGALRPRRLASRAATRRA